MKASQMEKLAKDYLDIPTLQTRNSDRLDFHEVSVWSLKQVMRLAYEQGRQEARATLPIS